MTEKEALRYFTQIIEANTKCKENGFIHRDLKPENILVDLDSDEVKLIDFGLASEIQYEPYNLFRGRLCNSWLVSLSVCLFICFLCVFVFSVCVSDKEVTHF